MKCPRCGNEMEEIMQGGFSCPNCKKNNMEEQKEISLKKKNWNSKKKLVFFSLLIFIIISILLTVVLNLDNGTFNMGNLTQKNNANKETYDLNKLKLLKSNYIIQEKYNDKGDLTYYKYNDNKNEVSEHTLNYEYDNLGRVTKITTQEQAYITIEYLSETKDILSISYNIGGTNLIYKDQFLYTGSDLPIVHKYFNNVYDGCIMFKKIESNNNEYILSVEYDKNNQIVSKKVNLKQDKSGENIFEILEIVPLEYLSPDMVYSRTVLLDSIIKPEPSYIVSHGHEIYNETENSTTTNLYDNKDRILSNEISTQAPLYYKYNDIDDKTYEYNEFLYYSNKTEMEALGITAEESNNYTDKGEENKYKVYLNDYCEIIKIEQLSHEFLDQNKASQKLEEYKEYIDKNKTDMSYLITELNNWLTETGREIYKKV